MCSTCARVLCVQRTDQVELDKPNLQALVLRLQVRPELLQRDAHHVLAVAAEQRLCTAAAR